MSRARELIEAVVNGDLTEEYSESESLGEAVDSLIALYEDFDSFGSSDPALGDSGGPRMRQPKTLIPDFDKLLKKLKEARDLAKKFKQKYSKWI